MPEREADPDEAVVEEESHEPGADAGVAADGGADDGADELLRSRAGVVVEPDLQLRVRQCDEEHGPCQEQNEKNASSAHISEFDLLISVSSNRNKRRVAMAVIYTRRLVSRPTATG